MKVKKLIKLLKKEDPEMEVCIGTHEGNLDIFTLEVKEGYWDGCLQVLVRDEKNKFYNVIGAEYRSDIDKLVINPMSIKDAMLDNPDLPVKVVDTFCQPTMQKQVDGWRRYIKRVIKKVDKEIAIKHMNEDDEEEDKK
jgi:hypothetical protein